MRAGRKMDELVAQRVLKWENEGSRIGQARFYKSTAHTLETRSTAATGSTAPEAICLAALALKGVDLKIY
jgi:hypothetical protein